MTKLKLTREEFHRTSQESPYQLFLEGIRAKETRAKYVRTLRRILCDILEEFLEGTLEERAAQLVKHAKNNPDWTQDLLIGLSKKLKERTKLPKSDKNYLNPDTIPNYFKPLKKLFEMNNVAFAWKRIYATFPELDNITNTREWKRDEIHTMLKYANGAMDRAIILIAASSGIRLGGLRLTWEDLTPIYKIGDELKIEITESEIETAEIACAMLIIYKGTNESYPAFITPEAYQAILDYKVEWIKEVGKEPKPTDPVFKKEGSVLIMASPFALKKRVERILESSGLRTPLPKGQKRYEVPVMNGFRRFWNKTCKEAMSRDSPLASLIKKEFMMGHTGLVRLDRNYFKTQVLELAEEYLNAVPTLTISDEERTKAENRKLRKDKSELERQREEALLQKDEVKRNKQAIETMGKKHEQEMKKVLEELAKLREQLKKPK